MVWKPLFVFSTTLLLFGECKSGPETRYSRLNVLAVDLTGKELSEAEIELAPRGHPASTIKADSTSTRVLYGDYRLRVHAPGHHETWREVRILQPETLVRVELSPGSIGCPPPPADIGGRVERNGDRRELWVKAIAVNGIDGGETRVGESGYFLASGLEYSTYLVVVMQGEEVLHQQVVKTYPVGKRSSFNLSINLGDLR